MTRPPPPPFPPPPSRETDVAFGIVLILMALMLAAFLFFLPRLIRRWRGLPPPDDKAEPVMGDVVKEDVGPVESSFNVRMKMADLRPLKP